MAKIAGAVFLLIVLGVLANEIYFFWSKNSASETRYSELKVELTKTQADYGRLQADFSYYLNPANLEKEVRARFNYIQPGEKMIIIVPSASSTSQ